jgi:tripartite-type tricarboxylate transporter receptor subunit TctC
MKRRQAMMGLNAFGLAACGLSLPAAAQTDFPAPGSTVKYVVPFVAGGLTDVMARIVGQRLAENWRVNLVIENKAGANAQTGADFVAKGIADGSLILAITQSHAVNVSLFPNAAFSFTRDLRPVALLADSAMLVVVPAASPIKDFKQLMALSKSNSANNPKSLNASSAGSGSGPHLTLELFNDLNGSKIVHVPYKGGAPSMTDLIAGHVDVSFSNFPNSLPFVKSGQLRALAVCSQSRHPDLPEVPTARESGMPDLVVENWTAVMAPAKTPDAIVDKYSREFVKIMNTPDIIEKVQAKGYRVNAKGADDFGRYLKAEVERWGRVVRMAKITAD